MSVEIYDDDGGGLQVMEGDSLAMQERSLIDAQIATAKRFPRSMSTFLKRATDMATIDLATAGECIYNKPVGKDKNGKPLYAEGMSIRMAEIVLVNYGNMKVGSRILSQTPKQVIAQGCAYDLENNVYVTSEVVVSTVYQNGTPMKESQAALLAQGALSKAMRNAIFRVVPKSLAKPIEEAVRKLLVGDAKSLSQTRNDLEKWVRSLGIDPNRVWKSLGCEGLEDLGSKEILTLRGIATAIKNGDTKIDEAFPEIDAIPDETQPVAAIASDPAADYKAKRGRKPKQQAETIDVESQPVKHDEKTAKMQEVKEWVENGCEVRDDYLSAIQMLQNFVDAGTLKAEWQQDAVETVKKCALEKGIRL